MNFSFYLQDILSHSNVALHIEVRPRYLIPDTNTFIDDLELIKKIANAHPLYQLMIPIVGKFNLIYFFRGLGTVLKFVKFLIVFHHNHLIFNYPCIFFV